MPSAEMHALEKAALDDPFLADAIEGMQQTLEQHGASVIHTHLQEIGQQVQERTVKKEETRRVVAFRWWQVAVAAAIIVVAGIGIFRNNEEAHNEPSTVAKVQEQRPAADLQPTVAADSVVRENALTQQDSPNAAAPAMSANQVPAYKSKQAIPAAPKPAASQWADAKEAKEAKAEAREEDAAIVASEKETFRRIGTDDRKKDSAVVVGYGARKNQDIAISNTATRQPVEQIIIPRSQRDSLARGYYTKPRSFAELNDETKDMSDRQLKKAVDKNPNVLLSGYIKGRVADQFNNPLYNAVVRTTDDEKDFLTDKQGYFKIPIAARDSMVKVAVGFNGYYTQNLRLQNYSDNNITLNQLGLKALNPALNTTVRTDTLTFIKSKARGITHQLPVKGSGDRSDPADAVQPNAQPEYGWLEYHQYLDKNKKLPQDNLLTGNVVVSFLVDKKGRLSDFKVEESLRNDYDEEAVRLIKAGPSWKLLKGSKVSRATVIVHF